MEAENRLQGTTKYFLSKPTLVIKGQKIGTRNTLISKAEHVSARIAYLGSTEGDLTAAYSNTRGVYIWERQWQGDTIEHDGQDATHGSS